MLVGGYAIQGLKRVIYPTNSRSSMFDQLATLLIRLYGEKDAQHFKDTWISMMYTKVKHGLIFSGATILSLALSNLKGKKQYSYIPIRILHVHLYLRHTLC